MLKVDRQGPSTSAITAGGSGEPGPGRLARHDSAHRGAVPRLLLLHPGPENRPCDPAFDDRRTLDRNPQLTPREKRKGYVEAGLLETWGSPAASALALEMC